MAIPRLSLFLYFSMHISTLVLVILWVRTSSSSPDENNTTINIKTTESTVGMESTKPTQEPIQIWPNRTVYFSISNLFSPPHLRKIKRVIEFIEKKTCIQFVRPSEEQKKKYYLFISAVGQKCRSELGWTNEIRQNLTLLLGIIDKGCFSYSKLLELMLRALGFKGIRSSDHKMFRNTLCLRKKHLKKLNEMYDCKGLLR